MSANAAWQFDISLVQETKQKINLIGTCYFIERIGKKQPEKKANRLPAFSREIQFLLPPPKTPLFFVQPLCPSISRKKRRRGVEEER
jgi:hypothetical protein